MPVLYSIGSLESVRSTVIHEPDFPKTLLLDTNVLDSHPKKRTTELSMIPEV